MVQHDILGCLATSSSIIQDPGNATRAAHAARQSSATFCPILSAVYGTMPPGWPMPPMPPMPPGCMGGPGGICRFYGFCGICGFCGILRIFRQNTGYWIKLRDLGYVWLFRESVCLPGLSVYTKYQHMTLDPTNRTKLSMDLSGVYDWAWPLMMLLKLPIIH